MQHGRHFKRLLRQQLRLKYGKYIHKEMFPSAITNDIQRVEKVIDIIEYLFVSQWEGDELVSVSTGIVAPSQLIDDLLNARDNGTAECMKFISSRCSAEVEKYIFDTLNKTGLMTFSNLKKVVNVNSKDKITPLTHYRPVSHICILTIDNRRFYKI